MAAHSSFASPPSDLAAGQSAEPSEAHIRRTLARFTTGVTVVTTGGHEPQAMTVNSFTSVSLTPPLVLICVNRRARLHGAVLRTKAFAVSVLGAQQRDIARHFADSQRPSGSAQFTAGDWAVSAGMRLPVLNGAIAWLECALEEAHPGGDHTIMIGRITGGSFGDDHDALIFHSGRFHQLQGASAGTRSTEAP